MSLWVSLGLSMCLHVSLGLSMSLPLPLSLSFSGISINLVYYASLLLRTFAFEIAAGGLGPQVAPGAAQAPPAHWGPNQRVQGPQPPHPICADPRPTLPTSLSAPTAPRPWGPGEEMLYYLEGEPGQGSCTPSTCSGPVVAPSFHVSFPLPGQVRHPCLTSRGHEPMPAVWQE